MKLVYNYSIADAVNANLVGAQVQGAQAGQLLPEVGVQREALQPVVRHIERFQLRVQYIHSINTACRLWRYETCHQRSTRDVSQVRGHLDEHLEHHLEDRVVIDGAREWQRN